MTKEQGWYYKYDAAEAAKYYFIRERVANALLYLLMLGPLLWMIQDFISGVSSLWLYLLSLCIINIAGWAHDKYTSIHNIHIWSILFMECDPEKMLEFISLVEPYKKWGKKRWEQARMMYLVRKAQIYLDLKRPDEGLTYLKQADVPMEEFAAELLRLTMYAYYAYEMQDRAGFDRAKQDMEKLPALKKYNKAELRGYKKQMAFVRMRKLLWDGKKEEARALISSLLQEEMTAGGNEMNRVFLHMRLADLDIEDGDQAAAKPHLEYVISHGNTLGVVEDAKKMIEEGRSDESVFLGK